MSSSKMAKITGWIALGIAIATILAMILGGGVMWLWNWLMPTIFSLPEISYWQAVGLLVLSHLLFKSHYHCHQKDRYRPDRENRPLSESLQREENLFAKKIHTLIEED